MTKERLFYLLHRYVQNQLSSDEEEELMAYVGHETSQPLLDEVMERLGETLEIPPHLQVPSEEMLAEISRDQRFRVYRERRIGSAKHWRSLALLLSGVAAIWFLIYVKTGSAPEEKTISPGTKAAILTLADGKKISLNAEEDKLISVQGATRIQASNGKLIYQPIEGNSHLDSSMENTITTPSGGEYQATLPDGTKVWLNAASSIRYPVDFETEMREVSITGEVYLEVTQRKNQPFYVKAGNTQVEVLGTKFNVSTYPEDKEAHTTLIEGRVKVLAHGQEQLLKPGQQATVSESAGIQLADVDIEEVLAWKNGYFAFSNEPLEQVMTKISRWYNVEVEYAIDPANKRLEGTVSRMEDIHQLLKALELTKTAHFKIKEGRIIVMK